MQGSGTLSVRTGNGSVDDTMQDHHSPDEGSGIGDVGTTKDSSNHSLRQRTAGQDSGLAIANKIVEAHMGPDSVSGTGREGGAEVSIVIPIRGALSKTRSTSKILESSS